MKYKQHTLKSSFYNLPYSNINVYGSWIPHNNSFYTSLKCVLHFRLIKYINDPIRAFKNFQNEIL